MKKRYFSAQEILFEEGEKAGSAFIIREGSILLSKKTRSGIGETVAVLDAGHIVGEVSLITGAPHSLTATAKEDGHALILTREDFDERLARSDKVITMVLKAVIDRLRGTYS